MNTQESSYRNLSTSGCFRSSPSDCMSDYGHRSIRDTMNFITYVEKSPKKSKANPAAVGDKKLHIPSSFN